jgi:hypothetical protein
MSIKVLTLKKKAICSKTTTYIKSKNQYYNVDVEVLPSCQSNKSVGFRTMFMACGRQISIREWALAYQLYHSVMQGNLKQNKL